MGDSWQVTDKRYYSPGQKMSTTSLASAESADEVLYEEDTTPDSPSLQKSEENNSTGSMSKVPKTRNAQLIEDFLTYYIRYQHPFGDSNKKSHYLSKLDTLGHTAIVLDYEIDRMEPCFEDLQAVLSDILSLKVRYKVVATDLEEEKVGFYVVKVPATNHEDRQLAALASVDHREILFYSHVVPDIKECLDRGNIQLDLSFVQCFYAHYDRPIEEHPVMELIENLYKAESIIVLEDLRPQGFGKRHFIQPLSLVEVKTALREIAKIHSATWCIQEISAQSLSKSWPFHYKPEYAAMLYEALLEDGLSRLEKHLKELVEVNRDMKAAKSLERLGLLKHRGIRNILYKLMSPAQDSTPNCLVHMDFWCDNLFFRTVDADSSQHEEDGLNYFDKVTQESQLDNLRKDDTEKLECRILDWQMFSIGKPTHDVALLLFTSLDPQMRKDCSDGLLEFYFRVFRQTAALFNVNLTFDLASLYDQFKKSQLLAVLQIIASVDLVLSNESTQDRLLDALMELIDEKLL